MSFQYLTGKHQGRFRETRGRPFRPNMGGEGAPVKSKDIEEGIAQCDFCIKRGVICALELQSERAYLFLPLSESGRNFLAKVGDGRKRRAPSKERHSKADDAIGEGGPDEAVAFIAGAAADLAKLARRHRLEVLGHLLEMAQLEAEERVRLRSKRNLS